jgi:hypothetical protein
LADDFSKGEMSFGSEERPAERDVEEDDHLVEVGVVVKASEHDGEPSQTAKSRILGAFHILFFVLVLRVA